MSESLVLVGGTVVNPIFGMLKEDLGGFRNPFSESGKVSTIQCLLHPKLTNIGILVASVPPKPLLQAIKHIGRYYLKM